MKSFLVIAIAISVFIVGASNGMNVYVDVNPARESIADTQGYAIFSFRGVTVQDPYIFVIEHGTPNFTYKADHSESLEDMQNSNPGATIIKTLPDGVSDIYKFPTGVYTAFVRQGLSDQPEVQTFEVGGGDTSRIVFMGAAYASGDESCCTCHNETIVDAPGYIIHHPEINHTILHPAGVVVITIVDVPEWTETIIHPEVFVTSYRPEVNHTEWRYVTNQYQITESKWFPHVGMQKVKCTNPSHTNGWHVQIASCTGKVWSEWSMEEPIGIEKEFRIVVKVPAWYDSALLPAWTETVYHPAITHTETRTVGDPWYETVVDKPAWDEQVGAITHEERICGQKLVCPCGCVRGERE